MLLYIIEKGIFDSTLYLMAYTSMLIVLFIIIFLYILFYLCILRHIKFVKELVEGQA